MHVLLCLLLMLFTSILFNAIHQIIIIFYLGSMVLITFVSPALLIWIQRYKSEIRGPWDEARIMKMKRGLNLKF